MEITYITKISMQLKNENIFISNNNINIFEQCLNINMYFFMYVLICLEHYYYVTQFTFSKFKI